MAILAHCTMPTSMSIKLNTFQPLSLFCLPPPIIKTYATIVASSNTAANDIKKPTDRHIEQKYLSLPEQSAFCGKCIQILLVEEQLRCRPIVLV